MEAHERMPGTHVPADPPVDAPGPRADVTDAARTIRASATAELFGPGIEEKMRVAGLNSFYGNAQAL